MKCPECGGKIIISAIPYHYKHQIYLGEFEAENCVKCGATYFTEKAYSEIEKAAKMRKLWGIRRLRKPENILTAQKTDESIIIEPVTLYSDLIIVRETALTTGVY